MVGTAYGVGIGPGDPELVTLKALRIMSACDVIAFPGKEASSSHAFRIASACLPELSEKELLPLPSPMVDDRALVETAQRDNASHVGHMLDEGKDVAILVLGDPAIYSTFSYMRDVLTSDGYRVDTVSGVPSFCAAAARLGVTLAAWDEPLHIVPLTHRDLDTGLVGTQMLMKAGDRMGELREYARAAGRELHVVERCGMDGEHVYSHMDDIPDHTSYLSVALLYAAEASSSTS